MMVTMHEASNKLKDFLAFHIYLGYLESKNLVMKNKTSIYYKIFSMSNYFFFMFLKNENKVRDINCQNSEGLTALLLVCRDIQLFERLSTQTNRPYDPVECVQELLAHRA